VFGVNGTRLMVGGEAGAEAILPLSGFYTELNSMLDQKLRAINQNVNAYVEIHNYIDSDEVASKTTEKVSDNLAMATMKRR
jgi:phage-related minor tail protein